MKNWKIKKKLRAAFFSLLSLFLIGMIIALYGLQLVSENVTTLAGDAVPTVEAIWKGRRAMVAVERALYMASDSGYTGNQEDVKKYVEDAEAQIFIIQDEVLPLLESSYGGDRTVLAEYRKIMESVKDVKEEIYEHMLAGDIKEGIEHLKNDYTPQFVKAAALLAQMTQDTEGRVDEFAENANNTNLTIIIVLVVLLSVGFLGTLVIIRTLTNSIMVPVNQIKDAAQGMAEGNFADRITYVSKDELGELSENIKKMAEKTQEVITDTARGLKEVADGNFNLIPKAEYVGEYTEIKKSIATIIVQLSNTMEEIALTAEQVDSGSRQVARAGQTLSEGAGEQASAVEELVATITETREQAKTGAKQAEEADQQTVDARVVVAECNKQMDTLLDAMKDIQGASEAIEKIIGKIEEIASQTSLLSLNAAIEAARAGEAGRGFAVVADEVRSLSEDSATAVKDTAELIRKTMAAVEKGSKIAEITAKSMQDVNEKTNQIRQAVSQIATTSEVQANSLDQIMHAVDQISQVVQENSAASEEIAASSQELSSQSEILNELAGKFQLLEKDARKTLLI